jgi:hypothetical protein
VTSRGEDFDVWVVLIVLTALPSNPLGARFDRPR